MGESLKKRQVHCQNVPNFAPMKKSTLILLQTAIWAGVWSIFAFTGKPEERLPMYYLVLTIRVLGFALFFNVTYYFLLSLYFSGKRKLFAVLAPLLFLGYVAFSIVIDLTLGTREKMIVQSKTEKQDFHKDRPLSWIIIPPVFLALTLSGVAAAFRGFSEFENKKKEEEEATSRRLEAEIALLKSQINPHFLLNTLNNLYTLALVEPKKTPEALLKLSEMVGYILHECARPTVSLSADLGFINNYIALQRLRLSPNVDLQTDLPQNLAKDVQIEPMILIPFIENAFKHGLTTKQECRIFIAIKINGDHLSLVVKNPLLPPKREHNSPASGMGMANTRRRLAHSYAGMHTLHVATDEQEHRVELNLNLGSLK